MWQTILVDVLIGVAIVLLVALSVAAIVGIAILLDFRRLTKEIKEKVLLVTSIFDLVSLVTGSLGLVKKKVTNPDSSTFVAFVAGLKKALQVLLKK